MACLKCGKETGEDQVFCSECKQIMEQYPVKPGTPIQLPKREVPAPEKKTPQKKKLTPEQQVAQLRLALRRLVLVNIALLALSGVLLFLLLK